MTRTDLLRAADPAAHLDPGPDEQLLREIVGTARPRSSRSVRRVALGGLVAAAAAVAMLVLPMPWDHHGPQLGSAAYAVDRRPDGSVQIVLRWDGLDDPTGLQHALDAAGARTVVLFGDVIPGKDPGNPPPACAIPWYGHPYSARAVQWDFPDAASEVNGVIIRPQYFPKDGTFVIEAYRHPGASTYGAELSFMARGAVPTCAYPEYGN